PISRLRPARPSKDVVWPVIPPHELKTPEYRLHRFLFSLIAKHPNHKRSNPAQVQEEIVPHVHEGINAFVLIVADLDAHGTHFRGLLGVAWAGLGGAGYQ